MTLGKLITFEGIDGCGKSTQMRLLEQYLTEQGVAVVSTREPGGTELGRKVRSALLDGGVGSVEPLAELLLYAADRAQHVRRVILPALAEGKVVLSDRFYDATTVYQGYARGFDLKLVNQLNELATGGLKPDLTLLFDLDAETGLKRTMRRGDGAGVSAARPDRLDQEPVEFHERVRKAYLDIAARESQRFRVIPSAGPVEETFKMMIKEVRDLFG
ncbi:MAG TPA: dTMP kinase [Blastocatellia bacterium]|nr:dTMP kinase [Blastocatellia bacterium]